MAARQTGRGRAEHPCAGCLRGRGGRRRRPRAPQGEDPAQGAGAGPRPARLGRPADRGSVGEEPPARPADQVSVLVSRLRRALGPDRLTRTDAGYSLAVDWFDVDELEARVDEAVGHLDGGRLAAAGTVSRGALA